MIDRRGMHLQSKEGLDDLIVDRFKYDQDDEEEEPTYFIDPYDISSMRYRASFLGGFRDQAQLQAAKRAQLEGQMASAQAPANASNASALPRHSGSES